MIRWRRLVLAVMVTMLHLELGTRLASQRSGARSLAVARIGARVDA
jgi:hypothetical protein